MSRRVAYQGGRVFEEVSPSDLYYFGRRSLWTPRLHPRRSIPGLKIAIAGFILIAVVLAI